MSLQLVTPGEPLAAEDPVADERPLAGVPAQVGPQMGRLAVHLPAALHVADVLFLLCGISAVPARKSHNVERRREPYPNQLSSHVVTLVMLLLENSEVIFFFLYFVADWNLERHHVEIIKPWQVYCAE